MLCVMAPNVDLFAVGNTLTKKVSSTWLTSCTESQHAWLRLVCHMEVVILVMALMVDDFVCLCILAIKVRSTNSKAGHG